MAQMIPATLPPKRNSTADWIVPIAAVGMVFVMLVPVPALVLDLLLATSMTASVLVLLAAINILRPAQFSVFPSLLLLLTLFRLSLNLASSRRILLHGNEGAGAAGRVIEAFGQFVVGDNYVVGFVLFVALIAIQYIVVSHGACAPPKSPPASPSMPCRASRWPSTPTSTPASSTKPRRAPAASRSRMRPNSTAPWTARRASTSAMPWPPSSSPPSISWPVS